MSVDLDFVGAFTNIVKDPVMVGTIFNRALIADNYQLGMIDEPCERNFEPEEEEKAASSDDSVFEREAEYVSGADDSETSLAHQPLSAPSLELKGSQASCIQAVRDYYLAFSRGLFTEDSEKCTNSFLMMQRDFLKHRLAQKATYRHYNSLVERYSLRITNDTIASVFPHILNHAKLSDALAGEMLVVASEIHFFVDSTTARKYRIEEQMNFEAALANIVATEYELDLLLSKANLALPNPCVFELLQSTIPMSGATGKIIASSHCVVVIKVVDGIFYRCDI
ncbi:unnamed protein product [Phytophthora lilii]|uniref:Unnamed protein product n=1 Tax=Phytophthora lilii TaxID=2077276 RepID=A0A9W6X326_9STRA|nr:unnamed protein product [Phytophthora lilii]